MSFAATASELKAFKTCRRMWWLRYYRQLDRRRDLPGARRLGTVVHRALDAYYLAGCDPAAMFSELDKIIAEDREKIARWKQEQAEADPALAPFISPGETERWEEEWNLARIMLEGYVEWAESEGIDASLEDVSPEEVVSAEVTVEGVPVEIKGKLDIRARDRETGKRVILDHKTAQAFSRVEATARLNEQILHYQTLELLTSGDAPAGAFLNILRKVKRTARAKPPFYKRIEVWHNISELRSYFLRMTGTIREILSVRQALDDGADHRYVAFPTPSADCTWRCDFFAVCPMLDDEQEDAEGFLALAYEVRDPLARYNDDDDGKEVE